MNCTSVGLLGTGWGLPEVGMVRRITGCTHRCSSTWLSANESTPSFRRPEERRGEISLIVHYWNFKRSVATARRFDVDEHKQSGRFESSEPFL